ncbi:hypothetical protein MtrunA17_Chr3g0127711 [Medicago truncatula]|nr:hypothetical protein MtrunA17_Chr3g0127711 [Medicago truncatula]
MVHSLVVEDINIHEIISSMVEKIITPNCYVPKLELLISTQYIAYMNSFKIRSYTNYLYLIWHCTIRIRSFIFVVVNPPVCMYGNMTLLTQGKFKI